MGYKIRSAFIFLLSGFCFAVHGQQSETDSLKHLLKSTGNDEIKIEILYQLTNAAAAGEWEAYNQQMKKLALVKLKTVNKKKKPVYYRYLAVSYNNEGLIFKKKGEINKAIDCFKKSLGITALYKDNQRRSITLINLGRLHYDLGDVVTSLSYLSKSIDMYEKSKDSSMAEQSAYAINFVGQIHNDQRDFALAMKYYNRSLDIFKSINDRHGIANTYSFMGACYFSQHRNSTALSFFQKAIDIFNEIEDKESIAANLNNIGLLYQEDSSYSKSIECFKKSLEIFGSLEHKSGIGTASKNMGETYLLMGDDAKAIFYFNEALNIATGIGYPHNIESAASGLYRVYKKQGKLNEALAMHELQTKMHDSINNDNVKRAAINNEIKYEYGRKQFSDSLRTLEEKKIIHAQLAQSKTNVYVLFLGLALFLLLGVFIFQRLRFSAKVKELKLRNRIAGDLHDEVGSALSSISMYASVAQMQNNGQTNDLVGKIELTSRETLDNMSDIVWSLLSKNDKLEDVFVRMKKMNEELFKASNVEFEFMVDPNIKNNSLNMEQRKNFYLIFKEAINNASKYSKAKKIEVNISNEAKNLVMKIKDNGVGFDPNNTAMGNGLYTMKHRAEMLNGALSIQSNQGSGTLITLRFKPA